MASLVITSDLQSIWLNATSESQYYIVEPLNQEAENQLCVFEENAIDVNGLMLKLSPEDFELLVNSVTFFPDPQRQDDAWFAVGY